MNFQKKKKDFHFFFVISEFLLSDLIVAKAS